MKKCLLFAFGLMCMAAVASMCTAEIRAIPAVAPQAVSSGASVTNTVRVSGLKGIGEVLVSYGTASTNCAVTATLYTTNTLAGGWRPVASNSVSGVTSGVVRVPFMGEYMTGDLKVTIGAANASATAGAVILSY